jgi:hypothetical protein
MVDLANDGSKKKRKKKNKAKEKLTNEELANYDVGDLVNYITGGKRKDLPNFKDHPGAERNQTPAS